MEAMLQTQCIPWTIPEPCQVSGPCAQPTHGPCFTAIPCQVRRLLRDCAKEANQPGHPQTRMETP